MTCLRSPIALVVLTALLMLTALPQVAAQEDATPTTSTTAAESAAWPMFRGNPAHTGTAVGPGPSGTPGIRWRFETGGGQASPVVAGGIAYVVSDTYYLWALDAATGEERWRFPTYASAPAIGDGLAVIGSEDAVYALDAVTGEQRWRFPAGEESGYFAWPSPNVSDGVVYASDFEIGVLYALDAATGEERWRFETGVNMASSPAVADGVVYIATETVFNGGSGPAAVIAVNAATGAERWRSEVAVEGDTYFSSPAVVDGGLYIGSQNPDGPGALRAFDLASGEERWRFEIPHMAVYSSPAVADGLVFVGGNGLYAVNAATGDQRWRLGIGEVWSSPAVVDGTVYIGTDEGYLVAADAVSGQERWTIAIGGGGPPFRNSSPAIADGMVYIQGSDSYFYAVGDLDAAATPASGATDAIGAAEEARFAELSPELLMEATIAADLVPPDPAFVDVIIADWPAGIGYRYENDSAGVSVNCVLSGQWAYSLIEPAATGTPVAAATPGTETTLGAGDCVTLAANVDRDERNPGSEPLELLNVVVLPEDFPGLDNLPPEITMTYHSTFITPAQWSVLPPGPIALALQRASLAADASVAPYDGDGLGRIGAAFEPETHLSQRADGSVRNLGDSALDVMLFTARPAGTATERESTPVPQAEASASPMTETAAGPAAFDWQTSGGSEPFALPADVAVDADGNLWVADGGNNQFQIFGPDGAFLETWGAAGSGDGEFDFIRANGDAFGSVAFDGEGNIFVADAGNRRIQKFDRNRAFVTAWGDFGTGDGRFVNPIYVTVDGEGHVYVTDDRRDDIQKFANDGTYLATFAGHGSEPGQIVFTGGVAVDAEGNLYVADFGNNRVQKFAPDGSFVTAWGSEGDGPGEFVEVNNVAVNAAGHIFVADSGNHRIQVFAADGQFLAEWGEQGAGAGQFNFPVDVALDGEGGLYVADIENNRVQKFRLMPPPWGAAETTATPTS